MVASTDILFYIAFLGQIFLTSYYFPNKILNRMDFVLKSYPPEQYPLLYPRSEAYYKFGRAGFRIATRLIFGLGFVILFAVMFLVDHANFADDGFISEFWPALYGIIQFLPLMALEVTEFKQLKLMRQQNSVSKRKADLRRRGLFDMVSPLIFFAAIACIVGSIVIDYYVHEFPQGFGSDTSERALVLTMTNLLLAGLGAFLLYGKKLNPHQSSDDRNLIISSNLRSLCYCSIALSIFFVTQAVSDVIDMAFLDATLMSIYFILVVYISLGENLKRLPIEDMDFEVYKKAAL